MPEKQHRPQDSAQRAAWARYIGACFYPVKREIALYLLFLARVARTMAATLQPVIFAFNLYGQEVKILNRLRTKTARTQCDCAVPPTLTGSTFARASGGAAETALGSTAVPGTGWISGRHVSPDVDAVCSVAPENARSAT